MNNLKRVRQPQITPTCLPNQLIYIAASSHVCEPNSTISFMLAKVHFRWGPKRAFYPTHDTLFTSISV